MKLPPDQYVIMDRNCVRYYKGDLQWATHFSEAKVYAYRPTIIPDHELVSTNTINHYYTMIRSLNYIKMEWWVKTVRF